MVVAECPSCEARIKANSKFKLGQRLVCKECDQKLEIVNVNPVEFELVFTDIPAILDRSRQELGRNNKNKPVLCPLCRAKLTLPNKVKIGQIVDCLSCDAELEVVSLNPVELDWPYDGYEDDFDEDEFDDFDDF